MADKQQLSESFDKLMETYQSLFKQCSDALAADTPQAERDALKQAIDAFLES